MDFWNNKDLPFPPISTYKASTKDIDLQHFFNVCQETKQYLDDNQYMNADYLVLSRLVYRMKQKFRSSKDFKTIEIISKCLKSFFNFNISDCLETVLDLIPGRYKKETYLPSKNLIDFVLVKLQGFSKLLEKIVDSCMEAGVLLQVRFKLGHFWKVGFIAYSVIARIYILAKYNTNKICEFYNKLMPFSSKLQCTTRWLPADYKLPIDLKEWLNISWLELDDDIQLVDIFTEIPNIPLLDLVDHDDDDIEFCEEYILIKDDSKKDRNKPELMTSLRGFENDNDIGEIIDLDDDTFLIEDTLNLNKLDNNNKESKKSKMKKIKNKKAKERNTVIELNETCENENTLLTSQTTTTEEDCVENVDIGVIELSDSSFSNENLASSKSQIALKKKVIKKKLKKKKIKLKNLSTNQNIETNDNLLNKSINTLGKPLQSRNNQTRKEKIKLKKALKLQMKNKMVTPKKIEDNVSLTCSNIKINNQGHVSRKKQLRKSKKKLLKSNHNNLGEIEININKKDSKKLKIK